MPKIDSSPPGYEIFNEAEVFPHGHLPLAAAYCRRLGLAELIDQMVPSQMHLRPGLAVQAMVLDTLSGRTPLYRLEEFMADQDVELLLGENVPAHLFNDNNLARSLDAIFEAGSSKILTEVGVRATKLFALDPTVVSYDTTSTSVWGDYFSCENEGPSKGPSITHGYSKDHRPDLKQFMTELLCVERGIPIFASTLDGNSSDKNSNNQILTRISSIMAKHGLGPGAFVYVADSAMITKDNLEAIDDKNKFVSRLSASYSACSKAVTEAVDTKSWIKIGYLAENPGSTNRPDARYKAFETSVELYGKKYRVAVVHSDLHDKRRQKKSNKAVAKSSKKLTAQLKKITTIYHCEADACEAAKKVAKLSGPLHSVEANVHSFQKQRPGRPPKNKPAPMQTKYEIQWDVVENEAAMKKLKAEAGCFVLICNVPLEGNNAMDAAELLRVYKGQYGVESDFAFLKDPLVVNDTFLKKPQRIDALGMILVIALLVWRLMERSLRAWIKNTGQTLPGWDKKRTTKPTTFMVFTAMHGMQVFLTKDNGRHFLRGPSERQREYLRALGLDESVFTDCHHACVPINLLKKGG